MIFFRYLFICLLFVFFDGYAAESNELIQKRFLGEYDPGLYSGVNSPEFIREFESGQNVFLEDKKLNGYFDGLIQKRFFDLYNFWNEDFSPKSICPDSYLENNFEYIRYLFRLVTMSYLFEANKEYQKVIHWFGGNGKVCTEDIYKKLKKCKPNYVEMKKFTKRLAVDYFKVDNLNLIRKKTDEIKMILNKINNRLAQDVSSLAIISNCDQVNGCRQMTVSKAIKVLKKSCDRNLQLLLQTCNEKDSLYGVSSSSIAKKIIKSSNVMNLINDGGLGVGCIDRYVKTFSFREKNYPFLSDIFFALSEGNVVDGRKFFGKLFLPGSLKEFDDKGLKDFLVIKQPKKIVKKTLKKTPKVVVAKKKVIIKKKTVVKPKKIKKKKVISKSHFYIAHQQLIKQGLKSNFIKMTKFKNDFIFTDEINLKLQGHILKYQTIKALKEMKKFDKLGTKRAPVMLLFLKYLIDNNLHQGLYNIISVLGERFYVINDIDKTDLPVYISIKNDKETNFNWQIIILSKE